MESHCCESLLSYEPVVEAMMTMSWGPNGWQLYVRHRHWSGRLGSCPVDDYENLSLGELQDVLGAIVACWQPDDAALIRLEGDDAGRSS